MLRAKIKTELDIGDFELDAFLDSILKNLDGLFVFDTDKRLLDEVI